MQQCATFETGAVKIYFFFALTSPPTIRPSPLRIITQPPWDNIIYDAFSLFLGPVLRSSLVQSHMMGPKDTEPLLTQVHQPYVTRVASLAHLLTRWRLIKTFDYQGTLQA